MKTKAGVTFIELLVIIAIVAILITLAVVIYSSQIRQTRRSDALNSLSAISLAEEQYRSNNTQYGTLAQVWSGVTASTGGYYTLSISNVSGTGYTLTAAAIGDQANDTEGSTSCSSLQLIYSSGTVTRSPAVCWPQ